MIDHCTVALDITLVLTPAPQLAKHLGNLLYYSLPVVFINTLTFNAVSFFYGWKILQRPYYPYHTGTVCKREGLWSAVLYCIIPYCTVPVQ
jgi:hypothetical protein